MTYDELKSVTEKDLLKAAILFYRQYSQDAEIFLRIGFALSQPDGWKQIAPAWLEKMKDGTGK